MTADDIEVPFGYAVDVAGGVFLKQLAVIAAELAVRVRDVALTADVLESGKHSCLEAGMDCFLTKPVDPAQLEEMFLTLFPGEDRSHIVAA